jgi:nucleotide-binding universal stress UspA family protein
LYNGGPKFLAAVRQVTSEPQPSVAVTVGNATFDRREPGVDRSPVFGRGTLRAFQVAAAWAVAEEGARTVADVVLAAGRTRPVPPDVTEAWDHIRQLDVRLIAGRLLPDANLAALARELLAEVDQRRQLIITSRTFAPRSRHTYDTLAAELSVSRERVRQLEADALRKLAQASADDRYAPLRWRAASAVRPDETLPQVSTDAPAWMEPLLRWLSGKVEANRRPRRPRPG